MSSMTLSLIFLVLSSTTSLSVFHLAQKAVKEQMKASQSFRGFHESERAILSEYYSKERPNKKPTALTQKAILSQITVTTHLGFNQ